MMPMSAYQEEDGEALRAVLNRSGITWNDTLVPSEFEGRTPFEVDADEDGVFVQHWEVGWSWWSQVQRKLAEILGTDAVPSALHIHAWNGVAVPGEIENTFIGTPRRLEPAPKKGGFLKNILGGESDEDRIQRLMDEMVLAYGGPYANLMVVSLPSLVSELRAGIDALGYDEAEMQAIYETDPDNDPEEIAKCYMLMAHIFLREALERRHLVWFIK